MPRVLRLLVALLCCCGSTAALAATAPIPANHIRYGMFGAYFDVGITAGATDVGIIVHQGNTKDPGPNEDVNPSTQGNDIGSFPA